jgi:hypothetical protein
VIRSIVLFAILSASTLASAQGDSLRFGKKIVRYAMQFLNDSLAEGKPKLLLYPVIAYSPETSLELGFSGLFLYQAKQKSENRLSEVQLFSFATLNEQYGAWFDHFLYGDNDRWFFLGRLRFQRFPLYFYGIGANSSKDAETVLNADYTLIKERVLRKVSKNFFVGLEIDFQRLYNVKFNNEAAVSHSNIRGYNGTQNLGLGLGLVYDSRKNALNVRNGLFAELAFLRYNENFVSDYSFRTIASDVRFFRSLRPKQVLALQAVAIAQFGAVPFNQLALVGGESLMRGYYTGRFRDKNYIAAQAEYRWLPFPGSKRFGGALFASAGTVAPSFGVMTLKDIHPAAGVGLRFLVFPKKDIFIRTDFALTPEGTGFYIYTGEAF